MLCLTGCEKRLEKTVGRIERHRNFMHEVRIDLLDGIPHSFSRLNEYDGLLLTLRSVNQGGGFTGSDDDRNSILRKIAEETKALIDVEYRPDGDARSLFDGDVLRRTVLSFHDFSGVPARLEEIAREMDSSGAGLLKIAVKCEDTSDLLRLFNLKAFLRRPALLIGMGIHGRLSRFLYKRFGSPFTFAVEDENAFGGAGLLTLKEIRDFGLGRNSELEPLGVIGGDHVVNSSGVKVYNRLFRDKGLDFIYLPLPAKDFDGALELAEKLGFQGLSVTMPHKEAALKKCAEASVQAEKTGAVNTLARRNHGWYGENTDINGLKLAMRDIAVHEGLRAAVFGCGGAARAAVYLMTKAGADVTVFHRDSIKAGRLSGDFGVGIRHYSEMDAGDYDIFINASPVGMNSDDSPVTGPSRLRGRVVVDFVNYPSETGLIREARAAGARVVTGADIWIYQGLSQLKLWLGEDFSYGDLFERL